LKTMTAKLYEGMFLVDSALAASDWDGVNETIKAILERFNAEIVSMKKWDERKLAYPVKRKDRGVYILVFFKVDGTKISDIERTAQLSEQILRVMILCAEDYGQEYLNKTTPAVTTEETAAEDAATPEQSKPQQSESGNDESAETESVQMQAEPDDKVEPQQ